MTIDELVLRSGDSDLLELKYDCNKNLLEFTLDVDDLDQDISFEVVTKEVRFGNLNIRNKNCHLRLISLLEELSTNNGIYIPSTDFGEFMNETRKGYNLAYGKRITEISHILILTGSDIFFIASIENKEAIKFNEPKLESSLLK